MYLYKNHCHHCIPSKLSDCAWAVGDLDVRAYLQDKVVSRVRACLRTATHLWPHLRSTMWSGGEGLRWVPPSLIHEYLVF